MARPKIKIDPVEVYKLAILHCTDVEIAGFFECSVDTITRRFADILHKARQEGRIKLRRLQWQVAESGSHAMCIWLGKQYLDQKEKNEETKKVTFNSPEEKNEILSALREAYQVK